MTSFSDAAATWNKRFAADDYVFGTEPNEYLRDHAGMWPPGSRVLCVADGEGRNSIWLARQGLQRRRGRFLAVGSRRRASSRPRRGRELELLEADLAHWTWPKEAYDVVAGIFFQFASPDERAAIFRT